VAYAAKGIIQSSITASTERDHNGTKCEAAIYQKALTTYYHRQRSRAVLARLSLARILLSPEVSLTTIQVHAVTSITDI